MIEELELQITGSLIVEIEPEDEDERRPAAEAEARAVLGPTGFEIEDVVLL